MARYWVGNTGNWNSTANWSDTSGGSGGSSVPTSSDAVIFDANSFSANSQVCTIDGVPVCLSLDATAVTETVTFTLAADLVVYGSFELSDTITRTGDYMLTLSGTGTHVIDLGLTNLFRLLFDSAGSYTLQSDLEATAWSNRPLQVTAGMTFDANDFNVTTWGFMDFQGGTGKTVYMGSGTWTVKGNGSYANFVCFLQNGTYHCETSTLRIESTADNPTIRIDGGLMNRVELDGSGSPGSIAGYSFDNITANELYIAPGTTVQFPAGQITINTLFDAVGTSVNPITLTTVVAATDWNLDYDGSDRPICDYLDIAYCNATPSGKWYAGANSTDSGNNTGWIFLSLPSQISGEANLGAQMISNGTFDDATDWSMVESGWSIADGAASFNNSGMAWLRQPQSSMAIPLVNGSIYRVSFEITTSGLAYFQLSDQSDILDYSPFTYWSSGYHQYNITAGVNGGLLFYAAISNAFSLDNVSVKKWAVTEVSATLTGKGSIGGEANLGAECLPNTGFDDTGSPWSFVSSRWSLVGNRAYFDNTGNGHIDLTEANMANSIIGGVRYKWQFDIAIDNTVPVYIRLENALGGLIINPFGASLTTSGHKSNNFICPDTAGGSGLWVYASSGGGSYYLDNISIKPFTATLVSATLTAADAGGAIAGDITTSSAVSSTLVGTGALSGDITSSSILSATLENASSTEQITGAITTSSVISGTLVGMGELAGDITTSSSLSATMHLEGALSGDIITSTSTSATLLGNGNLEGSITTNSALSVTLIGIGELEGSATGSTALSSTFELPSGQAVGNVNTSSVVIGTLDGLGGISGNIYSGTVVSGSTVSTVAISGSISCSSILEGTGRSVYYIGGQISTESTLLATVSGFGFITGEIATEAIANATILGGTQLEGSVSGSSILLASIYNSSNVYYERLLFDSEMSLILSLDSEMTQVLTLNSPL